MKKKPFKKILQWTGTGVFLFAGLINLSAQESKEYLLYPDGIASNPIVHPAEEMITEQPAAPGSLSGHNREYRYVSVPTYQLYPADKSQNRHIGLVIAPGGGLRSVCYDKEGTDLALWLSSKGISCMVLKYRLNRREDKGKFEIDRKIYDHEVEKDAKVAMLTMNRLADSLQFNRDQLGMIGFSAGGWLTERITIKKTEQYGIKKEDWMPDFAGLIYFGNAPKVVKNESALKNLPPVFMAIARDDSKVPLKRVIDYLSAIALNVDKSELHVFNSGEHGFGLATNKGNSVLLWKDSFYNWMLDITSPSAP